MKSIKNITRFTYDTTDFRGWRVCITKQGHTFRRYYGDAKYGSAQKSLAAAKRGLLQLKRAFYSNLNKEGKASTLTIKRAAKALQEAA
ncbi:MAG: hypothetical protein ACPH5P_00150 [Akkermansiaceae bacterium]